MRETLDEAIGVSPVSTVDMDTVVTKGRRRVLRRRFAVAGAGSGVVVAAALALAVFGGSTPGSRPPNLGVGSAVPDGSAPVRQGETPEQSALRLASALKDGLTAALPEVQVSDGPTGQPGIVVFHDTSRYDSDIVITTAAGEGEIFFESWPGGTRPEPGPPRGSIRVPRALEATWFDSCADVKAPYQDCEQFVGSDGQTIVIVSAQTREGAQGEPNADPGGPGIHGATPATISYYDAFVTWTNAKVQLTIASATKRGDPDAAASTLLLTRQQLVAIATDPDLTVTA